jgi:hypothetical protein
VAQRPGLTLLLATVLLIGGCTDRPPAGAGPSSSPTPTYHLGDVWDAPPGWRLMVTGVRCGPAASLDPGDADVAHVCLVDVSYANFSHQARPFSGTADEPGPTWRVVGYDAQAHEFHGHGRSTATVAPGDRGVTQLVFEVPAGLRLVRLLFGDVLIDLTGSVG